MLFSDIPHVLYLDMFKFAALLSLAALVPTLINAQAALYGQCGGIGWTGATTCVSGSTCTYSNAWYSQCLPGSASATSTSSTSKTSSSSSSASKTSSTSSSSKSTSSGTSTSSSASSTVTAPAGNPWDGHSIYLSPYYASEVTAAAAAMTDTALAAKALKVAQIPTFIWLDTLAKVSTLPTYMKAAAAAGSNQLVQIVVYDLPDRDCAAYASNGEYSIANNGQANYFAYIDAIVAVVKAYPTVRVVAVVEPDSLANLVTNLSVSKCANAETTYKACVNYAMVQLNTVGVYMYLDAGHAGWLGWTSNLQPAATLFGQMYVNAGKPAYVRGLATNVANYNSLYTTSPDPITSGDPCYDEILYIQALSPLLNSAGFPAQFIVDQSRSGVQNIRTAWGDWCNVKGSGFGIHPTTSTGYSLVDSIVWVKPGGECDGTSNTSSPRYDTHCGLSDAKQPAPEAGTWFQAFFEDLVANANPAL